jgi:hypothetical protein
VCDKEDQVPAFNLLVFGEAGGAQYTEDEGEKVAAPLLKRLPELGRVVELPQGGHLLYFEDRIRFNVHVHHHTRDPAFSWRSFQSAHCAILVYSGHSRITYKSFPYYHQDLTRVCENPVPIVWLETRCGSLEPGKAPPKMFCSEKKKIPRYQFWTGDLATLRRPFTQLADMLLADQRRSVAAGPPPAAAAPPGGRSARGSPPRKKLKTC